MHIRSESAQLSSQPLPQDTMTVTGRSASYLPSSSSPFDHATGGFFADEDIEQLYALPEGAHAGRLRFTDDRENVQAKPAGAAAGNSGGSSPLYRSCSSGSDEALQLQHAHTASDKPDLHIRAADSTSSSRRQHAGNTAQSMQTSRDDRVFWVPDLGSQTQSFTEYTKQQMGSTLPAAAAAVHTVALQTATMPAAVPGRPSKGMTQAPGPVTHAWTSPITERGGEPTAPARLGHSQLYESAHAWTNLHLGDDSAAEEGMGRSWHGSYDEEEAGGPHPPLDPSPHSGILHATSGFRGGRKDDPRLRRFREAADPQIDGQSCESPEASTAMATGHHGHADSQGYKLDPSQNLSSSQPGRLQAMSMSNIATAGVVDPSSALQKSQQRAEATVGEPADKQYLRAPPSLAWQAVPDARHTDPAGGRVSWAEYCSDSDEDAA